MSILLRSISYKDSQSKFLLEILRKKLSVLPDIPACCLSSDNYNCVTCYASSFWLTSKKLNFKYSTRTNILPVSGNVNFHFCLILQSSSFLFIYLWCFSSLYVFNFLMIALMKIYILNLPLLINFTLLHSYV